jgi:hypothetical protein
VSLETIGFYSDDNDSQKFLPPHMTEGARAVALDPREPHERDTWVDCMAAKRAKKKPLWCTFCNKASRVHVLVEMSAGKEGPSERYLARACTRCVREVRRGERI